MSRWKTASRSRAMGVLCIESKSPVDIEDSLGMYHGNIFQDAPSFPFATRKEQVGCWGVETEFENVFLCGSSACRGGAVSGIPGHNAAKKGTGSFAAKFATIVTLVGGFTLLLPQRNATGNGLTL